MEYALVSVTISVEEVPEDQVPSPLKAGAGTDAEFFERGADPFVWAVTKALEAADISRDKPCVIHFGEGKPLLMVPAQPS